MPLPISHIVLSDSSGEQLRLSQPAWQSQPARLRYVDEYEEYVFRALLQDVNQGEAANSLVNEACARIRAQHPDLTNEQLYDALYDALIGPKPLERDPLMRFMSLAVRAIERMVEEQARCEQQHRPTSVPTEDGPSDSVNTYPLNSPTTLYYAQQFPKHALQRLESLATFRERHPVDAEVYELYDFLGCTEEEIAVLLARPVSSVQARRLHAVSVIRSHENLIE